MVFGAAKTQMLKFGNQKDVKVNFGGTALTRSETAEYLGLVIHENGKMEEAIKSRSRKANAITAQVRQNLAFKTKDALRKIFDTYLAPKLYYGSEMWHQGVKEYLKPLDKSFNQFWLLLGEGQPPDDVPRPKLAIERKDLNFMHRWHEGALPMPFQEYFKIKTGASKSAALKHVEKSYCKKKMCLERREAFSQRIRNPWNRIPLKDRLRKSASFKSFIKTWNDEV